MKNAFGLKLPICLWIWLPMFQKVIFSPPPDVFSSHLFVFFRAPGQPNDYPWREPEECAELWHQRDLSQWNDARCNDLRPYVCQVPLNYTQQDIRKYCNHFLFNKIETEWKELLNNWSYAERGVCDVAEEVEVPLGAELEEAMYVMVHN